MSILPKDRMEHITLSSTLLVGHKAGTLATLLIRYLAVRALYHTGLFTPTTFAMAAESFGTSWRTRELSIAGVPILLWTWFSRARKLAPMSTCFPGSLSHEVIVSPSRAYRLRSFSLGTLLL